MKIATWNVNGIRARHEQVLDWISSEKPEVICLQELKAKPEQVPEGLAQLEDYWCCWHGARAYSGVGLLVHKSMSRERPRIFHPDFDEDCRVAITEVAGTEVASLYVPNGGRDLAAKFRFMEALIAFVSARASQRPLILCGDINIAHTDMDVHPKERKPKAIGQLPEERLLFERLLDQGLVDIARMLDPENHDLYSWWAPWRNLRQRNIGWRIDYILASDALASRATHCAISPETGTSDHAPVVAVFDR